MQKQVLARDESYAEEIDDYVFANEHLFDRLQNLRRNSASHGQGIDLHFEFMFR